MIKLFYSHILLYLHTRSFSLSCSVLHPVYFGKLNLAMHCERIVLKHRPAYAYTHIDQLQLAELPWVLSYSYAM